MKKTASDLFRVAALLAVASVCTPALAGTISAFTSTGPATDPASPAATDRFGDLTSLTIDNLVYSNLVAAAISNATGADFLATADTAGGTSNIMPSTSVEAFGNLNLDTAQLNGQFTANFGQVVTDHDFFFLFDSSTNPNNDITIQAIDAQGNNVGSAVDFDNAFDDVNGGAKALIAGREWDRDNNDNNLMNRNVNAVAISLDDLGLAGNTDVVGFIVTSMNSAPANDNPNYDPVTVGLAVIPEPSSLAIAAISVFGLGLFHRRN